jgi:hypothetical protein
MAKKAKKKKSKPKKRTKRGKYEKKFTVKGTFKDVLIASIPK